MKRLLITIFLLLTVQSTSFAEWTLVTSSNEYKFYIDFETIKTRGEYSYHWELSNKVNPTVEEIQNPQIYLSNFRYVKVNCSLSAFMYMQITRFKYHDGKGKSRAIQPDSAWRYAIPGTIGESLINVVCNH